jgi:hypothetical protein
MWHHMAKGKEQKDATSETGRQSTRISTTDSGNSSGGTKRQRRQQQTASAAAL